MTRGGDCRIGVASVKARSVVRARESLMWKCLIDGLQQIRAIQWWSKKHFPSKACDTFTFLFLLNEKSNQMNDRNAPNVCFIPKSNSLWIAIAGCSVFPCVLVSLAFGFRQLSSVKAAAIIECNNNSITHTNTSVHAHTHSHLPCLSEELTVLPNITEAAVWCHPWNSFQSNLLFLPLQR